MPTENVPGPLSAWVIEDAVLEALGVDPEQPEPTELMNSCRAILGASAPQAPDKVALVIAGDFVKSVIARLPEGSYRNSYTLDRGAGMVGGKTMWVGDEVHVVLHSFLFVDPAWALANLPADEVHEITSTTDARETQARRTVMHEAQHVAMGRAGEDDVNLSNEPWARRNFLTVAHQVIAEYRAELAVVSALRSKSDTDFPIESLDVLREDLRRIATVEYQQHLDVGRLAYDVVQQTHHAWKLFAYVAAARRVAGTELGAPFPSAVTKTVAWMHMAEGYWTRFEELLSAVPSGDLRVDLGELARWTNELADLLIGWLRSYGFTWRDVGDNSEFLIESWHLVE